MLPLAMLLIALPGRVEASTSESSTSSTQASSTQASSSSSSAHSSTLQSAAPKNIPSKTAADIDLDAFREKVADSPQDAQVRYEYARALRLSGKQAEAARELLEATAIQPSLYIAYHELSLVKARPDQYDEAIERLNLLKQDKPKDLLLRVALSELLEKRGDDYQAAKVLVEIVFKNVIPDKYVDRVQSRIHFLLAKGKDDHTVQKVTTDESDEDILAPPLPESSLRRDLSASKPKDLKNEGFGHTTVVP